MYTVCEGKMGSSFVEKGGLMDSESGAYKAKSLRVTFNPGRYTH